MERIKSIYQSMGKPARRSLKRYLEAFGTPGKDDRQLECIRILDKQPDIASEELARQMYGNVRSKAYLMMKARLYERITEFLSLSLNPERDRHDKELPYFRDLIAYRRHMLNATVLHDLRHHTLAAEHYQEALGLSRICHNAELEADVLVRLRGNGSLSDLTFAQLPEQLKSALEATERAARAIITCKSSPFTRPGWRVIMKKARMPPKKPGSWWINGMVYAAGSGIRRPCTSKGYWKSGLSITTGPSPH